MIRCQFRHDVPWNITKLRPSSLQVLLSFVPMTFPTQLPPALLQLPRIVAPPVTTSLESSIPSLSDDALEPSIRRKTVASGQKPPCSGREVSRCSRRPSEVLRRLTAGLRSALLWSTKRALPRDDSQANRCENHARGSLNLLIREVSYPLILANIPVARSRGHSATKPQQLAQYSQLG